jgi:hypothetical protein
MQLINSGRSRGGKESMQVKNIKKKAKTGKDGRLLGQKYRFNAMK